jgi:hypothetical protein
MKNVIVVPFSSNASKIIGAYKSFDVASGKLTATVNREFQTYIDAWSMANDKGEASCKAMQKEIRDCEAVLNIAASGAMEKKTFTEYAQSAARALHFGVAFEASLKNNDSYKLPWSKSNGAKSDPKVSGTVQSTSREALDKTLSKVLAQMRILGLIELAADTLDLMLDRLDGFKETVLPK